MRRIHIGASDYVAKLGRRSAVLRMTLACLCLSFVGTNFMGVRPGKPRVLSVVRAQPKKPLADVGNQAFEEFVEFLKGQQTSIIKQLEEAESTSNATFSCDPWGSFAGQTMSSGGITRVLQGGGIIEKGACSFTCIQKGVLSEERAKTIRARQEDVLAQAGDEYSAAALSMVLHTRSPLIPTFRSDVRIFSVKSSDGSTTAWLGGGADLTPYYLGDESDIQSFHQMYHDLCSNTLTGHPSYTYESMKQACDKYFYLPARQEHRGTGGIFFDDLPVDLEAMDFVQGVVETWMPSWLPIVERHRHVKYTERQRHWQLLRRGRYLEFNLLYDRGVKFGLANANPRVEGVMVSAPPLIAYEYNHEIEEGSPEAKILQVLRTPREWITTAERDKAPPA